MLKVFVKLSSVVFVIPSCHSLMSLNEHPQDEQVKEAEVIVTDKGNNSAWRAIVKASIVAISSQRLRHTLLL